MVEQGKSLLRTYFPEGWHIFSFDGSAKGDEKTGHVGGYCFPDNWEFVAPLEEGARQT